jgi:hypothetical protein
MALRRLVLLAALSVALAACATKKPAPPVAAVVPAPPVVAVAPVLQPAQAGPWRITKTEWTKADEDGFGQFVRMIAESGCTSTIACMQSAANFYHDSDLPTFQFHADCAKWVYMLRAYYASKNGLPFSYVDLVTSIGEDPRFSATSNSPYARHDIVDAGIGIDTVAELQALHDHVSTATYRMDPAIQAPYLQDFYSPKIQPGSIRAGTAIYDINGHVVLVYEVTPEGSILYMDASPDESVKRGAFGPHIPRSAEALGGGFKNFRPLKLVGAVLRADGAYIGGTVVLAANEAIPDYSLEQYAGNAAVPANDPKLQFQYNSVPLDLYEYARASLSSGGFAYNPVYELTVTMSSLCADARAGGKDADARVTSGFATLYADLSKDAALWQQHDLRVVYHGESLNQVLWQTYSAQNEACVAAKKDKRHPETPFDRIARLSPGTDVQRLISQIPYPPPVTDMKPVGQ